MNQLTDDELGRMAALYGASGLGPGVGDSLRAFHDTYRRGVMLEAGRMAQHAGRNTITEEDVALAVEVVGRRLGDMGEWPQGAARGCVSRQTRVDTDATW